MRTKLVLVPGLVPLIVAACTDGDPNLPLATTEQPSYAPAGTHWSGGVVKYHLSDDYTTDPALGQAFEDAKDELESLTGLTFEVQTDTTKRTIMYKKSTDPACSSSSTLPRDSGNPGW